MDHEILEFLYLVDKTAVITLFSLDTIPYYGGFSIISSFDFMNKILIQWLILDIICNEISKVMKHFLAV